MNRGLLANTMAGLVFAAAAPALAAQAQPAPLCLRPAAGSSCRAFLVVEAWGQRVLARSARPTRLAAAETSPVSAAGLPSMVDFEWQLGWDAGMALNLTERWAVGATVGWPEAYEVFARRWLPHGLAVDLGVGGSRSLESERVRGLHVRTALHLWGVGFLRLQYDAWDVPPGEFSGWVDGVWTRLADDGGRSHTLSAGAGFESFGGVAVPVLLLGLLAVALSGLT